LVAFAARPIDTRESSLVRHHITTDDAVVAALLGVVEGRGIGCSEKSPPAL
jgi:hypothetical protein